MRRAVAQFHATLPIQMDLSTQVTGASLLDDRTIEYRYLVDLKKSVEGLALGERIGKIEFAGRCHTLGMHYARAADVA